MTKRTMAYEVEPEYPDNPHKLIIVCLACYKKKHTKNPTAHRVRHTWFKTKKCHDCGLQVL